MKKFLYNNKSRIIINIFLFALILFLSFYKLPVLVTHIGGIENISKKYQIDGANKINGSINLTYVKEVQPNIPYYLYAKLRGYEINKIEDEVIEDLDFTRKIERIMYEASISNSVYVAYKESGNDIKISNLKQYIYYNVNELSPLKTGDLLLKINDIELTYLDQIADILKDASDNVKITYKRDNKIYEDEITLMEEDNVKKIGITLINVFDYETKPKITYKKENDVYGPSAGAMTTLSIYCNLIDNDIVKGKKIAGSGEIYYNGLIGPVGGINYKIRSAAKKKVDIFFVPEYNYKEAIETKEKYNLKINIVSVNEFKDIIEYLENN